MRTVNASRSQPMKESMVVCNCALGHLCVKATRAPSACGCTPLLWVVRVLTWARKKVTRVGQGIPPQQANRILLTPAHSCEMVSRIFSMLQEKKHVTFFEGQVWILWYEGLWWTHPHLSQRKNKTHTHTCIIWGWICFLCTLGGKNSWKKVRCWSTEPDNMSLQDALKKHTQLLCKCILDIQPVVSIWSFRSKRTCGSK